MEVKGITVEGEKELARRDWAEVVVQGGMGYPQGMDR